MTHVVGIKITQVSLFQTELCAMHQSNIIITPAERPGSGYETHAVFEGLLAVHSVIEAC